MKELDSFINYWVYFFIIHLDASNFSLTVTIKSIIIYNLFYLYLCVLQISFLFSCSWSQKGFHKVIMLIMFVYYIMLYV